MQDDYPYSHLPTPGWDLPWPRMTPPYWRVGPLACGRPVNLECGWPNPKRIALDSFFMTVII